MRVSFDRWRAKPLSGLSLHIGCKRGYGGTVKDDQSGEKLVLWTYGHFVFTFNMKIVIVFESKIFVFKEVKHVPPTSEYQQIDVSFYTKNHER